MDFKHAVVSEQFICKILNQFFIGGVAMWYTIKKNVFISMTMSVMMYVSV